jgi:biopolymer transport protein ExbB
MDALVERVLSYIESGGLIMVPLVVSALIVWYALGYRLLLLSPRIVNSAESLAVSALSMRGEALRRVDGDERREARRWVVDLGLAPLEDRLGRFRVALRAFVVAAPLLGLLGTVTGMMETFGSLGEGALYVQGGGIAAGVSEALLTTQMGLAVALPGLFLGHLLDRRERRLRDTIEAIKVRLAEEAV